MIRYSKQPSFGPSSAHEVGSALAGLGTFYTAALTSQKDLARNIILNIRYTILYEASFHIHSQLNMNSMPIYVAILPAGSSK
jgi:hypothetical protein